MITLAILNFIINLFNQLVLSVIGNTVLPVLNSVSSYIDSISVPQTIFDIFSLVVYFLPMGTILTLFNLTLVFILLKIVVAVVHVLTLGVVFGE